MAFHIAMACLKCLCFIVLLLIWCQIWQSFFEWPSISQHTQKLAVYRGSLSSLIAKGESGSWSWGVPVSETWKVSTYSPKANSGEEISPSMDLTLGTNIEIWAGSASDNKFMSSESLLFYGVDCIYEYNYKKNYKTKQTYKFKTSHTLSILN